MPKIRIPGVPREVDVSDEEAREWPDKKQRLFEETIRNLTLEKRALERRTAKWRETRARAEESLWRSEQTFLETARRVHREALVRLLKK
jgi:hypothetical protein